MNASSTPTLAEKFELILSAKPDVSQPLTQFTPIQRATFEELIQWLPLEFARLLRDRYGGTIVHGWAVLPRAALENFLRKPRTTKRPW